jgi:hypothetical protein
MAMSYVNSIKNINDSIKKINENVKKLKEQRKIHEHRLFLFMQKNKTEAINTKKEGEGKKGGNDKIVFRDRSR